MTYVVVMNKSDLMIFGAERISKFLMKQKTLNLVFVISLLNFASSKSSHELNSKNGI